MATKIYITGGAINIEGIVTNMLIINPAHFDWKKKGSNYFVRDGIENQSYNLGAVGEIQDVDGVAYASAIILVNLLNRLVNIAFLDHGLVVASGMVADIKAVDAFGVAPNGIQDVITDIWDRADDTPTQSVWLAPTAARNHAIVSSSASDTVGFGTLTLTGLPLDTETTTIGSKVYTWQDELTDVDGNVHIAANASDSIDNLIAAIMLGAGAGTAYAASMTAGDDVVATVGAGDTMLVYDEQSDALATTETLTNGSWGAAIITAGVGARQIQLFGLVDYDTKEVNEIISMHGDVPVNTVNDYVIIHRKCVLTHGTTSVNVGTIISTAETDTTITAAILPGNGQTEMAIYGVPSNQSFYLKEWRCNIDKNIGGIASADFVLRVNTSPDILTTGFLRKHDISLQSTGTSMFQSSFSIPLKIPGPAIIKVQAIGSADDIDGESSFDGYLMDN